MFHRRQSSFALEKHRILNSTFATITVSVPRGRGPLPPVYFAYKLSSPADPPRPKRLIQGLTPAMLKIYAPNLSNLLDDAHVLVIPAEIYGADGGSGQQGWPYEERLRDGRPFPSVLEWIRCAWASITPTPVSVQVPFSADELVAYLTACNVLGMQAQAAQLEKHILDIVTYRPLQIGEIKAVWEYATAAPLAFPHPRSTVDDDVSPEVLIPRHFSDPNIVCCFAQNLRTITPQAWRGVFPLGYTPPAALVYQQMLPGLFGTGNVDPHKEFDTYLKAQPRLWALMWKLDLAVYVEVMERKADKMWRKERLEEWIVENRAWYGKK
ncbi:hypothetical protein K505DRAFT_98393 [Melanomma pulvis-pyrius CBS 109.77]|uniref:Uncharacterized protein n=1 Tax=Melanomma pulvis-pyrius CBS 109.77 TaxID=1314802 RepID=A0A6A6WYW3_9PLEO|nr:hypothetical protein K505DRAFT_98393 [Melanomma pulvis-pyrius CBS 109.77]